MELNWTTFVLEILNFLVLVWILKHFLYRPVLAVIARRRAGIEQTLREASEQQAGAEALKAQYEDRLAEWDRERAQAREALTRDIEAERAARQTEMEAALDREREKARVGEAHRLEDLQRRYTETALAQGARFATRLLESACGPDTEARLVDLFIGDLGRLTPAQVAALRNNHADTPADITVSSAYPLSDDRRERLRQALATLCGEDAAPRFEQDDTLLAGVRITIGAWVLGANVRDELRGFAELSHVD